MAMQKQCIEVSDFAVRNAFGCDNSLATLFEHKLHVNAYRFVLKKRNLYTKYSLI